MPNLNFLEIVINEIDGALRTLAPPCKRAVQRQTPAMGLEEPRLNSKEKRHIAGLMRVNHAGEVCAQALYQGQALTAQLAEIKQQMNEAAEEETDHLAWCEQRLEELNSQPSLLNPFWFFSSFILGAIAGKAGDSLSLGFVAETERQVAEHLRKHLKKIPSKDKKSRAIIEQMHIDESQHAETAERAGAQELPWVIKKLMQATSQLMTRTSYYL